MTPSYGKQWGRFADAYLMAAEALVRELEREEADLDEPQTRLDYLVFPTVYLFRHYVELRLKEIIEGGLSLLNDPTAWQMNHDLKYLWALTRKILSQVYPNDSVSDLDCVERLILQIHSVDPGSFGYRYPTDPSCKQYDLGLERISIKQFANGMAKIGTFLGSASFGISVYLDHKHSA